MQQYYEFTVSLIVLQVRQQESAKVKFINTHVHGAWEYIQTCTKARVDM